MPRRWARDRADFNDQHEDKPTHAAGEELGCRAAARDDRLFRRVADGARGRELDRRGAWRAQSRADHAAQRLPRATGRRAPRVNKAPTTMGITRIRGEHYANTRRGVDGSAANADQHSVLDLVDVGRELALRPLQGEIEIFDLAAGSRAATTRCRARPGLIGPARATADRPRPNGSGAVLRGGRPSCGRGCAGGGGG